MRWRRRWRVWLSLSSEDRRLVMAVLRLWPVCRFTLRRRGAQVAADRLLRISADKRRGAAPESATELKRVVGLVYRVADRLPGRPTCLERSLLTASLLRRRGIEAEVKIGVRQAEGAVDFHAWVTVGADVVSDAQERVAQYQPLALAGMPTGS